MNTVKTRVPFEESYVCLLGQAVYLFAYYESMIIAITDRLEPGFRHEYFRGKPLPSGVVHQRFFDDLEKGRASSSALRGSLESCRETFEKFIPKRNALIHAHPITDLAEGQILNYQTDTSRPIHDLKWDRTQIRTFIQHVDKAACEAGALLDQLR